MSDERPGSSLTPLEIASGLVFGAEDMPRGELDGASSSPRAALEAAVLPALRRPPCVVSFSGGLDSSVVLAVAVHVARREGCPLPLPATLCFPGVEEADESAWQASVIDTAGIVDWEQLTIRDELSVVGPVATRALREHGLLWPFNAYVHIPILDLARGGSVLTGFGGDELFLPSRWTRLAAVRSREASPRPRDLRRAALALAPRSLRRRVLAGRCPIDLPWLRAEAHASLARAWASEAASEPVRVVPRAMWRSTLRSLRVASRSLGLLAGARDVQLIHPFAEPSVVAAFATHPSAGTATRGDRLRDVAGGLLPVDLFSRRTKASFNTAFWRDDAKTLAASWDGEGVDPSLVDPELLRATWAEAVPDGRTFTALQSAWLSRSARATPEASRGSLASSPAVVPTIVDGERRSPGTRQG